MTGWPGAVATLTLFVEDLERSATFYRAVFGLSDFFADDDSVVFKFDNLLVNLLKVSEAAELVAPGPVGDAETGARAVFTVEVEDVDATCAELAARGVTLVNGPMDRPWGVRTASFRDPAGHVWEVAGPVGQEASRP